MGCCFNAETGGWSGRGGVCDVEYARVAAGAAGEALVGALGEKA